jgi:putative oxidoreductase
MDVVVLIGRVVFALLFLSSGFGHFMQTDAMAGYAAARGVPAPKAAVQLSGLLLLVGGLSVVLGVWADLGTLLLVLFLVPTAVLMHGFWRETDPNARQLETIQFTKDIALAGAAFALFGFFAGVGPDLGLTLTGPLFSLS